MEHTDKLDFKRLLPVFLVVMVDLLGLTIIIPLLPLYAASFGANPGMIGLLEAAYPAMQFIGAPVLGRLSDRYGRKPVLMVSQLGTFVGFLMLAAANALPLLFLSRIIDGLSGANISTAQAIITDSTNEKTRTQGLGLLGAAFGLGFIIGPLIAFITLAISGNNYHVPALVAAGCSALSILLTWFRLPETHRPGDRSTGTSHETFSFGAMIRALAYPGVGILLLLIFAQQIAFGGFEQILALFTLSRLGLDASGNAIVFVFVGLIVVMVQGYFIGKWSRSLGDRKLIYLGLSTLALGLALTAFTPAQAVPWYNRAALSRELTTQHDTLTVPSDAISIPAETNKGWAGIGWLLIAMIPASIGGGILQPSINSLITKRISASERGGILGISAAFLSASNLIAPLMGGFLFQANTSLPFGIWAGIMGLLFVTSLSLIKPGAEVRSGPPIMESLRT